MTNELSEIRQLFFRLARFSSDLMAANSHDDEAAAFRYNGSANYWGCPGLIAAWSRMALGWQQSLGDEDASQHVVVEPPLLRLAVAEETARRGPQDDEPPGWNITDQTTIPPYGECRYVIELAFGQAVFVGLVSTDPVEAFICDDDDYDRWTEGESCLDVARFDPEVASEGTCHQIGFRTATTGLYSLVVCNPEGESVDVIVRIVAAPDGSTATKGPSKETRRDRPAYDLKRASDSGPPNPLAGGRRK